jgi:hypothetical protein
MLLKPFFIFVILKMVTTLLNLFNQLSKLIKIGIQRLKEVQC